MVLVLGVLLLGALGTYIPTDAEISAQIEAAIRAQVHPASVQVVVKRQSDISTTVERLDITIIGFSADTLPFGATAPAAPAAPAATAASPLPTPAHRDDAPRAKRPAGRQIRIKDTHLVCKDLTLKSLAIQELTLDLHEMRIPWACLKGGGFTITSVQNAGGYVVLPQKGLTQFLRTRKLMIQEPEVVVTPDGCRVRGTYHMLVSVPVEVSGLITCKNRAELCLENPKLKVSAVTLPELVTSHILKDLDPFTDLNTDMRLPAPLTITRVTHQDGGLRLDAILQFTPPE